MRRLVISELVNGQFEPIAVLRPDGTVLGRGPTADDLRRWARRTGLTGPALLRRAERAWSNAVVGAVIVDRPEAQLTKDISGAGGTMTGAVVSTPTYGGGVRRRRARRG